MPPDFWPRITLGMAALSGIAVLSWGFWPAAYPGKPRAARPPTGDPRLDHDPQLYWNGKRVN